MKIKFLKAYKKAKKNHFTKDGDYCPVEADTVYVYAIQGWNIQLALYKQDKGSLYCEDAEGNSLWFTTRFLGTTGELHRSRNGNYYAG
jgi:hypothetical protein